MLLLDSELTNTLVRSTVTVNIGHLPCSTTFKNIVIFNDYTLKKAIYTEEL